MKARAMRRVGIIKAVWRWLRGKCEECGTETIKDTFEVGGMTGPTTIRYCPRCDRFLGYLRARS